MYVCMYIYIYMYIHVYTHIYTYAYAYTHTYAQQARCWSDPPFQIRRGPPAGRPHAPTVSLTNKHVCFCGRDPGNLKFWTVRTNKQHICF